MQDKWAAYVDIEMGLTKEAQNCGGWSSMGAGGKEGDTGTDAGGQME